MTKDQRPISMAELAEKAGVSISTVSRALAGSSAVNTATRDRVTQLAQELEFRPNAQARNLRLRRSHAIGVVLPLGHQSDQHFTDPFFLTMLGHLADVVADRGYDMLLSRVVPSDNLWLDRLVDSNRADGVIVIGQSNQLDQIDRTAARYRRLVTWGAQLPGEHAVTIGTDNEAGGRMVTDHLIAKGRRRLLFLGDPIAPEITLRYQGFVAACDAAGIAPTDRHLLPAELVAEQAYALLSRELPALPAIDGIVAASDVIAMAGIRALADHGRRVPEDVSVTGFDDVLLAAHTVPPLTTVRQDLARGAKLMVDALFELMAGRAAQSVAMAPELIIRASS